MLDGADVVGGSDHALGEQKPGGQRAIEAGRAHDHRERAAVQADVERLLRGCGVDDASAGGTRHASHLDVTDQREVVVVLAHGLAATVMISTLARAVASETGTMEIAVLASKTPRQTAVAARAASSSVT